MILRRTMLGAALAGAMALSLSPASAADLEQSSITLGVGGKPLLYYLPLTIAEQKGFFEEEGLDVAINDFGGGSKSLQALVGGSVDVVTGAYEHTIRMQAKNQDIRAVIELGRFPGIVLAVKKDLADQIKSPADLAGRKVGVTAPGSSTNFFVNYLMAKDGADPQQAAFIGVGAGLSAVAAMQQGEIEAISNLDPVISKLEADDDIVVLADSRTEAGTEAIFGASIPAAVVYMKNDFIEANPNTVQALVNSFKKALDWLATASPEEIAEVVPAEYHLGNEELYLRAVAASQETYSRTGIIPPEAMQASFDMLKQFDPELASAEFDLDRTFTDRFVTAAGN
ncbi:ABC transporter substrate-binding protein [Geminicoccus roseus]|uniref:ABC transporter substrate-binding protein n=1 Tax=Geminicoccus roseus TaxID=404900 RepID=UPI000405A0B8|nr:ABC transporter substrate-binding protein [Geminicoccus roseus]